MRATFRVDASAAIGSGHLARCLTLASALARNGIQASFAAHDPSEHTRRWIVEAGHTIVALPDLELETALRAAEGASLVVVDGYTFGPDLHDALRRSDRIVVAVDDVGLPVRADAVLNGNFFGEEIEYPGVRHRLQGPAFALVRAEFAEAHVQGLQRAPVGDRPRLLLTMGGADPARATELFMDALESVRPCEVRVVVGGANPRVDTIRDLAARRKTHDVRVLVDVARMSEQMAWCDLAIAAAGSTCLELACLGTPAVVVAVADNQIPVAREVARRGLMVSLGELHTVRAASIVSEVERLLDDPAGRAAMVERQRHAVDGHGARRVAERLTTLALEATRQG